jgi:hypothetical protein
LAKNASSKLLWKNFINDENVLPDVSYEMPLGNFSRRLDFFFRKTWQRFHRPGRFTGILEKSLWNKKCVFQRLLLDAARKNY